MDAWHVKLDQRLSDRLKDMDISTLSRLPNDRLKTTAFPNIGTIELVHSQTFADHYDTLYRAMFHGGERERSDMIVERLRQEFAKERFGLAPYRVIGIRDRNRQVVGGAQFSVLFLSSGHFAVPYLQYIYVRPENRRQDMSEILHTMVLAVATADAAATGRSVPFTLFETEPPSHGDSDASRIKALERSNIHTRTGACTLMLRRNVDGKYISSHCQPGLEPEDSPMTLVWMLRPSPAIRAEVDGPAMGREFCAAYYQSLRDEGFPEENIARAESIVEKRMQGAEFCMLPLADVTAAMYKDVDG